MVRIPQSTGWVNGNLGNMKPKVDAQQVRRRAVSRDEADFLRRFDRGDFDDVRQEARREAAARRNNGIPPEESIPPMG